VFVDCIYGVDCGALRGCEGRNWRTDGQLGALPSCGAGDARVLKEPGVNLYSWLREPGVAGEQLCTRDYEGVGPARGSRSTGPHWDPSARHRWIATSSTFELRPIWLRRLSLYLDATSGPSARSDVEYFLQRQTYWRGRRLSTTCWSIPSAGSTVGAGSPAAWFCSATRPVPWPRTWVRERTALWSMAWS
jgi:hypothetical protein